MRLKNISFTYLRNMDHPYQPSREPHSVVFENDQFVAVNKPSGLLSVPDRNGKEISLKQLLQHQYGEIYTIHRLDKETSGLILFAKNAEAHKYLSQLFEERSVEKLYLGLVKGSVRPPAGRIDAPIMEHVSKPGIMITASKGKPSLTEYEVLERFPGLSWMQFNLHTGRTHQVRVHMKHIGHPLVCDALYGDGQPLLLSSFKRKFKLSRDQETERPILGRLGLHAWKLSFKDSGGTRYELEAPMPRDLRVLLQQLRKWNTNSSRTGKTTPD